MPSYISNTPEDNNYITNMTMGRSYEHAMTVHRYGSHKHVLLGQLACLDVVQLPFESTQQRPARFLTVKVSYCQYKHIAINLCFHVGVFSHEEMVLLF